MNGVRAIPAALRDEAGVAEGRAFIVMQRVEGETLEERLARGPLPLAETVLLARQVADALAEASISFSTFGRFAASKTSVR